MSHSKSAVQEVTRRYFKTHQDPAAYAKEIVAVSIIRGDDTRPTDPLTVTLDQSAIDLMGWQPGDAVTVVLNGPESLQATETFIIRRAKPGESAVILDFVERAPRSREDGREPVCPQELYGPSFEWSFPDSWVKTFWPGTYDEGDRELTSSWSVRSWTLLEILEQKDQIELDLNCS